jgi:hypothetical protein
MSPGREGGQRRGHRINLDPAVFEDFRQALQLAGARLDELFAVPGQLSDRRNLRRRDETTPQQPTLGQFRQPHGIEGIALATWDVFDMSGVDQRHLQRPLGLAQGMEHRLPVHASCFDGHMRDALGDQPGHHRGQRLVVGVELAHLLSTLPGSLTRRPHRHRDDFLANVDRGDSFIHDLHIMGPLRNGQ